MPKTATSIQLTEEQIQHLVSIIQKGTIEVRVYKRAKILLLKAQLNPHKITYYCEKRDPDFDKKMRDVLVIYK